MEQYTLTQKKKSCIVTFSGNFTAGLVPDLKKALLKTVAAGVIDLEFNLEETKFIDSNGIGLLVAASNSMAQKKGEMKVILKSDEVARLFQNMRLMDRLGVVKR